VVVFAVGALFVVRMAAVSAALMGTDLPARSRLFIGWFGPRGIGTLVLGLLMIQRGEIEQSATITQAVIVTVTVSLVVHSLTAPLGIRLWPARSQETTAPQRTEG
jgi:NhaP-type Na+/H+ or K+/H+ antiporter